LSFCMKEAWERESDYTSLDYKKGNRSGSPFSFLPFCFCRFRTSFNEMGLTYRAEFFKEFYRGGFMSKKGWGRFPACDHINIYGIILAVFILGGCRTGASRIDSSPSGTHAEEDASSSGEIPKEVRLRLTEIIQEKGVSIGRRDKKLLELLERFRAMAVRLEKRLPKDRLAEKAKERLLAGDFKGVEKHLLASLEKNEKQLSEMRSSAARDAFDLGSLKALSLAHKEARDYFIRAVDLEPGNSEYLYQLGLMSDLVGSSMKAVGYYNKALEIDSGLFGEKHSKVSRSYHHLGLAWDRLGDMRKAAEYYNKALEVDLVVFGEKHAKIAASYDNLGRAWNALGDKDKAIGYYKKALEVDLALFGDNHPKIATRYSDLGAASRKRGELRQAIRYYKKALAVRLTLFGEEHLKVASSYSALGSAWYALGDMEQAIKYYEKTLTILSKAFGENHPNVIATYNNLGSAWDASGDLKQAIRYYTKVQEIFVSIFGEKHPNVAISYNNLGEVWRKSGAFKKAAESYQKALTIFQTSFGPNHPNTKTVEANLRKVSPDKP